jgi:RNA polymerase sigma factor (sigma-70 family)
VESDVQKAREIFARVVREHQKAVYAVALSKLGNAHDAEDVKQEVFVEAWRNMENLRNIEKISGWLYKATINKCRDHFREKSRRKRREDRFSEVAPVPEPSAEDPYGSHAEAFGRAVVRRDIADDGIVKNEDRWSSQSGQKETEADAHGNGHWSGLKWHTARVPQKSTNLWKMSSHPGRSKS